MGEYAASGLHYRPGFPMVLTGYQRPHPTTAAVSYRPSQRETVLTTGVGSCPLVIAYPCSPPHCPPRRCSSRVVPARALWAATAARPKAARGASPAEPEATSTTATVPATVPAAAPAAVPAGA